MDQHQLCHGCIGWIHCQDEQPDHNQRDRGLILLSLSSSPPLMKVQTPSVWAPSNNNSWLMEPPGLSLLALSPTGTVFPSGVDSAFSMGGGQWHRQSAVYCRSKKTWQQNTWEKTFSLIFAWATIALGSQGFLRDGRIWYKYGRLMGHDSRQSGVNQSPRQSEPVSSNLYHC